MAAGFMSRRSDGAGIRGRRHPPLTGRLRLVAFFGFGGGGVALGFANVGWVPLAPYEVFHPWWGRGFYGGPEYINRSVNIVNVNVTNIYRNARVVNGFTAVSGADFRSGRFNTFVRPSAAELTQANFARGPLPVTPNSTNLRYSDRQTAFMPRSTAPARVFSYRQQGGGILPNRSLDPPSAGRTQGGWTRFGAPVGQSTAPGYQTCGQGPAQVDPLVRDNILRILPSPGQATRMDRNRRARFQAWSRAISKSYQKLT
jgi:hypothetical protein